MNRYFWLKLKTDFFDTDDIKIVLAQENGPQYVLFWLRLLSKAVQQEEPGRLRLRDKIPYTDKLLASVLNTDVDIVRSAMKVFQGLGMVQVVEDGTIWIEAAQEMVGSEGSSAERMRRLRDRQQKALPSHCDKSDAHSDSESISSSISSSRSSVQDYSAVFESFWQLYPRRVEKKAAFKAWKATRGRGVSEAELVAAAKVYAEQCERFKTEERFIKHPKTFLGPSEPWRECKDAPVKSREEAVAALYGR